MMRIETRRFISYGSKRRMIKIRGNMVSPQLLLVLALAGLSSCHANAYGMAAAMATSTSSLTSSVSDSTSTPTTAATAITTLISTGLRNMGNTCYMNAQLQCAFHIPAVRNVILKFPSSPPGIPSDNYEAHTSTNEAWLTSSSTAATETKQEADAQRALRGLFQDMIQAATSSSLSAPTTIINPRPPVLPKAFCITLGIPTMVQQDSQEFWKLLLPATKNEALSDLYQGSFEDYVIALDGSGRERRREELFLDLSLDITSR